MARLVRPSTFSLCSRRFCVAGYYTPKRTITTYETPSVLTSDPKNDVDKLRKKLFYQSKERGMLENDLLLGNFARKYLPVMSHEELQEYSAIISEPDPDIFAWITGKQPIPEDLQTKTMRIFRYYKYIKKRKV